MTSYTWYEAKRRSNLRKHGLDFADAPGVLEGRFFAEEDSRFPYNERRYVAYGLFSGYEVTVAYTEQDDEIRIISFRKASRHERNRLWGKKR